MGPHVLYCLAVLLVFGCGVRDKTSGIQRLDGATADPLAKSFERPVVLVFVRADCPVANRYSPEITRLNREFRDATSFYLVYTDPRETASEVAAHVHSYALDIPVLRDTQHALVAYTDVRVTPEAAVLEDGEVAYKGRIDDWYVEFGVARPAPTRRELHDAIQAVLAGKRPKPPAGPPVGCYISKIS